MEQIPVFNRDQYGDLNATANLPAWQGFLSYSGFNAPKGDHTDYTDGEVSICVIFQEDKSLIPLPYQEKAIQYLIDNQAEIQNQMLMQLANDFPAIAENYDYLDSHDNTLPSIPQMEDFRRIIRLSGIYVKDKQRDGHAYVGYGFDCSWDIEHGLGIMTHKSRVIEIGYAETSFGRVIDPEVM